MEQQTRAGLSMRVHGVNNAVASWEYHFTNVNFYYFTQLNFINVLTISQNWNLIFGVLSVTQLLSELLSHIFPLINLCAETNFHKKYLLNTY